MTQRFVPLALAALVATPALAQTPSLPAPKEEKGPMTVDAQRMDGVGEIEMTARGNAEIKQDEMTIFGDYLKYNRELGWVDAHDGVRLQLGVDRFFGPKLRYNTLDDTGTFESPQFRLQRDIPTRGEAESIEFLGKDQYRMRNATYTTCEPGRNDWRLDAEELDLDYETFEGKAKHPRLKFFDTTVLAAPFAFFPLESSRKSGLLSPYYANSNTRGLEFGIPYYWNIAPEYDYTLTPVYMTKRGLMLKNEGRYINRSFRGEARLEYMPGDAELKRQRYGMSWQHTQSFGANAFGVVDYNRVSDNRYFVDLTSSVRQSSIGVLPQDAYINKGGTAFGLGYGSQFRVQKFQTLQDPNAPITPPYDRLPQISFSTGRGNIGGFLDTSLPVEYVRFSHPTLVEGSRVQANPVLSTPILAPGWFITPKAGMHVATYGLQNTPAGIATSPRTAVPWFSLDSGLIFDRDARWFGENLTQTLEPRLFYVYAPYRNQDEIPIFDTGVADFNFAQLFSENRFGGGDRFGDANQLTAAATTRFLQPNGQEIVRATVGQRFYFADERVALTPGAPLRTFGHSDYLASIGARLFRHITFDTTTQYNPRDHRTERYTVSGRYAPEIGKVLSASYRYSRLPELPVKQYDISGQWPIRQGWYAVGRYNYSVLDKRLLNGIAGVEYNAGCWVLRATMQRIQVAAQTVSTAFYIQLVLTGAGELGTDEALQLLRRDVPGYAVTNPSDPMLAPPSVRRPLPFPMSY